MGRPKGSTNKPKGGLMTVKMEKQIQGAPVCREAVGGYVKWGAQNDYPNLLLNLYEQSTTHAACINFAAAAIVGDGVDYEAMGIDGTQTQPSYDSTWDDFIKDISLDYALYQSFAIQIIKNRDGRTYSFYHVPMDKVRCGTYDSDGVITKYYVSNDWTELVRNPYKVFKAFGMQDDEEIGMGEAYLYVYHKYSPTQKYYSSPKYASGIRAIQSEVEFINYDLRSAVNNFTPTGMLTVPQVANETERQAVVQSVKDMFTGSENAGNVMVSFRANPEEQGAQYTPFSAPQGHVDLYDSSNERTINRILAAHQIPSRLLIGIPQGNAGFNSESSMLESAFNLYMKLVGKYNRLAITRTLNYMLRMNGIDVEIILKPLTFMTDSDKEPQQPQASESGTVAQEGSTNTNNIEEREGVTQ